MTEIRLGIIDRRAVLCASLCAFFEKQPDFHVVWTATSSLEAVQLLATTQPDAVLIDSDGGDVGISEDHLQRLTTGPVAPRLFLLLDRNSEMTAAAASTGAIAGSFLKTDSPTSILNAIRAVVAVNCREDRLVGADLRIDSPRAAESAATQPRQLRLTNRQIEIITHLADGASSKEIARRLHLSVKSVSSHSYRIMKRLNLHDRVALVRFAIREGLVTP